MLEKPAKLRGDLICLQGLGIDPEAVLCGSGVSFEDILAQKPLPIALIAELLDRLADVAPVGFGITAGLSVRLHDLGLLGYRLSQCDTIGELLEEWTRYSIIIGYPLGSFLRTGRSGWTLTFHSRYPLSDRAYALCIESTLAGFARSIFNMTGYRLQLREIGFPFARRHDESAYREIDAQRILFEKSHAYVSGALADLLWPMPAADAEARAVCDAFCRESLSRLHMAEPFGRRVHDVIRMEQTTNAETVARALGVSVRSMQRSLAAEDTSFHALIEQYRHDRAKDMIRQGFAAKVIAHELNYQNVASYYRAFKRWTGNHPNGWLETQA